MVWVDLSGTTGFHLDVPESTESNMIYIHGGWTKAAKDVAALGFTHTIGISHPRQVHTGQNLTLSRQPRSRPGA